MELELIRDGGALTVVRRRGWGWGVVLLIAGISFVLVGALSGITGQHLPQMSTLVTVIWAFCLGSVWFVLGLSLTLHGEHFLFTGGGLRVNFYRWRFVHWSVDYPLTWMQGVLIEPQPERRHLFRVVIEIDKRPAVELAKNLRSHEAWELASAISEPARLTIREA